VIYIDSSALFKLVKPEPESLVLTSFIAGEQLIGSELLLTEVRRAAIRQADREPHLDNDVLLRRAEEVCMLVNLVPIDSDVLFAAGGLLPPSLRSLDAIHLASALITEVDVFVSYDRRQSEAARSAGLMVSSPDT
jgi:predicted nucleic acid-binding protein